VEGSALLIGAGGLGCGAALALAAGGVRRIGVVDDDCVDESNLQRQVLHSDARVGSPKIESLARAVAELSPQTLVVPHPGRFDADTAADLVSRYDVVLDGSDNLATKFLANDAAVLYRRPLVHGASVATIGQLMTVPVGGSPCYRCLFEDLPPAEAEPPSCSEAGVLGPVPGFIGALQGAEALRLLAGQAPAFAGRLLRYESSPLWFRAQRFNPNPACKVCGRSPVIVALDAAAYQRATAE